MSRRDPNRKLNFERKQIRTILSDFRKAKHKCLNIYQELKEQMPDKIRLDSVQRETALKMELLDVPGLISLKSTLLKTLSQLFELQSQISSKKERIAANKELNNVFDDKNKVGPSDNNYNGKNLSFDETERQKQKQFDQSNQSSSCAENQQNHLFQIKLDIKTETNEQKLERISNFVKMLEKSMRGQSQKSQQDKLTEILLKQPQYCKVKEELERYQMKSQEIPYLINERINDKIRYFCQDIEIIEETQEYKIVKFYKSDAEIQESENSCLNFSSHSGIDPSIHSMIDANPKSQFYQIKKQASFDFPTLVKGSQYKDKDILAIEEEFSKNTWNVEDVVSKVGSTLQNSELRLKQLREQRKKIIMDEDVWQQFQKI